MKKMLLYFILWPNTQALVARNYHPPFLTFCLHIYFQYKFLYFFILTCSCHYSYNLMLTATCICRHYIYIIVSHIYLQLHPYPFLCQENQIFLNIILTDGVYIFQTRNAKIFHLSDTCY